MQPILWILSSLWFRFLERRIVELRFTIERIAKQKPVPPNHGILTATLMHLLRCSITNPQKIPDFVVHALRDLDAGSISDHFGMVFLHDLDLTSWKSEKMQMKQDDRNVHEHMHSKETKKRQIDNADVEDSSGDYPLGRTPTWATVKATLDDDVTRLLKPWIWKPNWDHMDELARRLFVHFAKGIWLSVVDEHLCPNELAIHSLEDAMKSFSVESIDNLVREPTYESCNAGLTGPVLGTHQASFRERRTVFFPPSTHQFVDGSVWEPFAAIGHINLYHTTSAGLTEEQLTNLHSALDVLFAGVQCLPSSTLCGGKSQGKIWKSKSPSFVTNPLFYRLDSVGSSKRRKKDVGPSGYQLPVRVKVPSAELTARLKALKTGVELVLARKQGKKKEDVKPKVKRGRPRKIIAEQKGKSLHLSATWYPT
jgi:hypothetical protein